VTVHPRALDHPQSFLSAVIPDEAELTAGQRIEPGRSYGFFTDTTLCIGCKSCEVACKEWNALPADDLGLRGTSYDNTGDLSATTWRHVHFIEHIAAKWRARDRNAALPEQLADDERCLQALLAGTVPRSLPDRGDFPHRVRHRSRAAGYLQWLRLLCSGLPVWSCGRQFGGRQGA
jgi:ferredoxin